MTGNKQYIYLGLSFIEGAFESRKALDCAAMTLVAKCTFGSGVIKKDDGLVRRLMAVFGIGFKHLKQWLADAQERGQLRDCGDRYELLPIRDKDTDPLGFRASLPDVLPCAWGTDNGEKKSKLTPRKAADFLRKAQAFIMTREKEKMDHAAHTATDPKTHRGYKRAKALLAKSKKCQLRRSSDSLSSRDDMATLEAELMKGTSIRRFAQHMGGVSVPTARKLLREMEAQGWINSKDMHLRTGWEKGQFSRGYLDWANANFPGHLYLDGEGAVWCLGPKVYRTSRKGRNDFMRLVPEAKKARGEEKKG